MPWRTVCNIFQHDRFSSGSVMIWGARNILGWPHRPPHASQWYPYCCKIQAWNPMSGLIMCIGHWVPPGAWQCVDSCRMMNALMPLTGPHIPQTWIKLRILWGYYVSEHPDFQCDFSSSQWVHFDFYWPLSHNFVLNDLQNLNILFSETPCDLSVLFFVFLIGL